MNFTAREAHALLHRRVEAIKNEGVEKGLQGEITDIRNAGSWMVGIQWPKHKTIDWLTKREFSTKVKLLK